MDYFIYKYNQHLRTQKLQFFCTLLKFNFFKLQPLLISLQSQINCYHSYADPNILFRFIFIIKFLMQSIFLNYLYQEIQMFTKTLRIGPLLFIQLLLTLISGFLNMMFNLDCQSYMFLQIAFTLFILETTVSLIMIQKVQIHKIKYIYQLAHQSSIKFYTTIIWNIFILFLILTSYIWLLITDGLTLSNMNKNTFYQYPLCLEIKLLNDSYSEFNRQIIWIIYLFYNIALFTLILFCNYKVFYYLRTVFKKKFENPILNQQLINGSQLSFDQVRCPICLQQMQSRTNTIELMCRHRFHSKCINEWLLKKLQCPYRCKQTIN